jgi:hypothetical protein
MLANNNLTKDDVKELIYSYEQPQVTDELYTFGAMLLNEVQERSGQIDSKAAVILGWATGILAFLFTQFSSESGWVNGAIVTTGGLFALLAVIFSYSALRARSNWRYPSDRDWFEKTALSDSDELKRFHIRSIHEVRQVQKEIAEVKGDALLKGQRFLLIAASVLAAGIGGKLFLTLLPILDRYVRVCLRVA